jgi:hypothetical protein
MKNDNYIMLDGDIKDSNNDCTFAKIREGMEDIIVLKQYLSANQKTSTIYLTKAEILKLVEEINNQ